MHALWESKVMTTIPEGFEKYQPEGMLFWMDRKYFLLEVIDAYKGIYIAVPFISMDASPTTQSCYPQPRTVRITGDHMVEYLAKMPTIYTKEKL
jgi:hypothetical protein